MSSGDRTLKIDVEIEPTRCVHAHSVWAICARCINACPGGALALDQGAKAPTLACEKCVGCGQCLSACPHTAFSAREFSERRLLERTAGNHPLTLRCFLPYGELDSMGVSQGDTYHLATCLAALSPGVLYELALNRTVTLFTGQCESCVLFARTRRTMAANARMGRSLLADCGRAANLCDSAQVVLPQEDEAAASEHSTAQLADASEHQLHVKVENLFRHVRERRPAPRPVLAVRERAKRVPAWRERLRATWDVMPHAQGRQAFRWPALQLDAKLCRACGICMQLCPTGSIRQAFGDGEFLYTFTPGTCADCGLCLISCPVAALSRGYAPAVLPYEESICLDVAAYPCPECGMPVFTARGEDVCRLCQAAVGRGA